MNAEVQDLLPHRGAQSPQIKLTWTQKVCKAIAFTAIIGGLGLLVYILLGFG